MQNLLLSYEDLVFGGAVRTQDPVAITPTTISTSGSRADADGANS
jgi:hypothetical protein